ncbi:MULTISPECIES: TniQ family protein [unclassified Streptomyces]|uniref:TniQ family protein n=1 Tax=unclassified Streptomyces TaxID=2593676 RepID=UPI0013DB1A57|nr:TniQ family protein [Streptomyces sp. RLA2-12]
MPTSLRRLALVPEPYPGESLLSWVDALARLNRISRLQALRYATFIRPGSSVYRPSVRFVAHLPTEVMARVEFTTGLSAGQLRRITLMHYADGVLPSAPSSTHRRTIAMWLHRLQLAQPIRSRACPACLRENGGRWLLRWRLIWSVAFVRHRVYLLSACRGCGGGLHQVLPGPGSSVVCGQTDWHRPGYVCQRSIWRMRPPWLSDAHLLECQRRLDDLVDHPHRPGSKDILRTLHLGWRTSVAVTTSPRRCRTPMPCSIAGGTGTAVRCRIWTIPCSLRPSSRSQRWAVSPPLKRSARRWTWPRGRPTASLGPPTYRRSTDSVERAVPSPVWPGYHPDRASWSIQRTDRWFCAPRTSIRPRRPVTDPCHLPWPRPSPHGMP